MLVLLLDNYDFLIWFSEKSFVHGLASCDAFLVPLDLSLHFTYMLLKCVCAQIK